MEREVRDQREPDEEVGRDRQGDDGPIPPRSPLRTPHGQPNEGNEHRRDGHPEDPATTHQPERADEIWRQEERDEGHSRSANAEERHRGALALCDVLLAIREIAGERDGGGEEPEDQGSEEARLHSRTAERHRRPDGHDRAEREERRDLSDSSVAELERRRTIAPCEDRASKTKRAQDEVRGDRDQSESRVGPIAAPVSKANHAPGEEGGTDRSSPS